MVVVVEFKQGQCAIKVLARKCIGFEFNAVYISVAARLLLCFRNVLFNAGNPIELVVVHAIVKISEHNVQSFFLAATQLH